MNNNRLATVREFVVGEMRRFRVLVIGDVMLDKYCYGEVNRISPEAPVPIVHMKSEKETLGGAANVAHNLALLGCETSLAGYIGDDHHTQELMHKLNKRGIDFEGLVQTNRPTTTKLRIIGEHQQMLRMDIEDSEPMEEIYAARLWKFVDMRLSERLDAVVISDYGKGACTESTCRIIINACHARGIPVIVDPKGIKWCKYAGADYLTPNFKELNAVLPCPIRNEDKAVEDAARYVIKTFQVDNILATRSEKGLSLVRETDAVHIPTKAQDVYDVSGAGDTVIAVFALALAGGLRPEDGAYLANLAASVVVAKLGTYAVSQEELLQALDLQRNVLV